MTVRRGVIMMIFNIPIWVIVLGIIIIFSGYMAVRAMRAEWKLEQHFIEKEGSVYMERIALERKNRRHRAI